MCVRERESETHSKSKQKDTFENECVFQSGNKNMQVQHKNHRFTEEPAEEERSDI